jgi:uncharacterized metal-binding protein
MKALFICFGCLSNTGRLTGIAGLKAIETIGLERANIFCLAALATNVKTVMEKTKEAEKIVVVDGCPLKCAKNIVEAAGFKIDEYINLVEDMGFQKANPYAYSEDDVEKVAKAIIKAIENEKGGCV